MIRGAITLAVLVTLAAPVVHAEDGFVGLTINFTEVPVEPPSPDWIGWVPIQTRFAPGRGCDKGRTRGTLLVHLVDGGFGILGGPDLPPLTGDVVVQGRKPGSWELVPDDESRAEYLAFLEALASELCDEPPAPDVLESWKAHVRLDRTGERLSLVLATKASGAKHRIRGTGIGGPTPEITGVVLTSIPWWSEPAPAGGAEDGAGLGLTSWSLLMLTAP